MPKCISSVEVTEAAIFRAIKRWQPSFCFDEFDSILASDDKAGLRSIINSGHTRGQGVLRCIGDDKVPELFSTFAPKCIGMVGRKLAPATLSRCIFIELRRRKKDERVEKFKHQDDNELADLRRRLRRFSLDNEETLRDAKPSIPDELLNRGEDNWLLMWAIADLCSGVEDFGDKARAAAVKIATGSDSFTDSARALEVTKTAFADIDGDVISSEDLIRKFTADPSSEWSEYKAGKPITPAQLARLLKPYGIIPEQIRIDGRQVRGYVRSRFTEAWERYL
jgi:putative DNA primase/helicase